MINFQPFFGGEISPESLFAHIENSDSYRVSSTFYTVNWLSYRVSSASYAVNSTSYAVKSRSYTVRSESYGVNSASYNVNSASDAVNFVTYNVKSASYIVKSGFYTGGEIKMRDKMPVFIELKWYLAIKAEKCRWTIEMTRGETANTQV